MFLALDSMCAANHRPASTLGRATCPRQCGYTAFCARRRTNRNFQSAAGRHFSNPKRTRINRTFRGREPVTIDMPATQLASETEFESLNPVQHESINARYQSLIRLAESIRARRDPGELFDLLACELCSVVQFDAIAQYDEAANKVHWHVSEACRPS